MAWRENEMKINQLKIMASYLKMAGVMAINNENGENQRNVA
jgi:hypothetical protein